MHRVTGDTHGGCWSGTDGGWRYLPTPTSHGTLGPDLRPLDTQRIRKHDLAKLLVEFRRGRQMAFGENQKLH